MPISLVPAREAQRSTQALKVAKELKYPVALKIESAGIIHKSDVGGVITNIYFPEELTRVYRNIGKKY